ncbi:MAG: M23 family metallopeptidase, partial [Synergistaceae bacterium]|nr:M23 family metallopeptidase [Synergistaceae bacterium]
MVLRLRTYSVWSAVFVFCLFSNAFAEEAPQPPDLASIPPLPSLQVFGTPSPPKIDQDIVGVMPDMTFWRKSAPAVPKAIPVDPDKYGALAWPVRGKVSSGYGLRGTGLRKRMHKGIDIPVPEGTPVQAASAGVVAKAQEFNGYGQTIILDHGNGTQTLYAHCSDLAVKQGEHVDQGQVIAYAGSTGRATTSHVHFGVMVEGAFRDPRALLS